MRGFEFHPLIAAIQPGTELTVTNEDSAAHTFTVPKLGVDKSLGGGETVSLTVVETGTYDFVCTLHPPDMLGRLVVTTETPTPSPTPTPTETPTPSPTETSKAMVKATGDNEFVPMRLSIAPGQTVTWKNTATGTYDDHAVTSARFHAKATQWSMDKEFSGGETLTHTFESEGVYEYYCTIHGKDTMCGAVLVGDVTLEKDLPCEGGGY